jgi:hypothetical protein
MADSRYDIQLDVKYDALTVIDVGAEAAAHEPWFNQSLTTAPEGVVHRTRAPVRTSILMVERVGVQPTGDG